MYGRLDDDGVENGYGGGDGVVWVDGLMERVGDLGDGVMERRGDGAMEWWRHGAMYFITPLLHPEVG